MLDCENLTRQNLLTESEPYVDDLGLSWNCGVVCRRGVHCSVACALDYRLPFALGVMAFLTLLIGFAILGALSGAIAGLAAALSPF